MEKKLKKAYLTFYSLLIAQDLWQAHYQILLILYLKDLTDSTIWRVELNINSETIIKNLKLLVKLNVSIATVFLNIQSLKMI